MATRAHVLRRAAALLACVVTLTATAGCSLLPGSSSSDKPEVERNTLRIGVMSVVDVAPLQMAKTQKLFENAGLQVQLVNETSETEAIKQLGTTLDIVWASHVNLFRAVSDGNQLQLQGEAYQAGANTMALVTGPNSDYTDAAKKQAPSIAVNNANDVGALSTKAVLSTAGVEKQKIRFQEMPFENMMGALESGSVNAAWMVEPFITKAQRTLGARIVTDTARGPTLDFPMSGYASSKKFADDNPKTLQVFRSVLREAQQLAANDKLGVQDALTGYADVDQQTAALVSVGTFPLSLNKVRLQRVADMMDTENLLPGRLDVQQLLPPGTTS
jgi:ABC-type nitrate/sulfonate/bicarbonate transport system substrate-binding protein